MSQREALAIAIKIISIWFFCQLFIQVSSIIPAITAFAAYQQIARSYWIMALIMGSYLASGALISYVLFRLSNSVLNTEKQGVQSPISNETQKFTFQIFGVFLIIGALLQLPVSLAYVMADEDFLITKAPHIARVFGLTLQGLVGLMFTVHSSWWVLLFHRLRGRA